VVSDVDYFFRHTLSHMAIFIIILHGLLGLVRCLFLYFDPMLLIMLTLSFLHYHAYRPTPFSSI